MVTDERLTGAEVDAGVPVPPAADVDPDVTDAAPVALEVVEVDELPEERQAGAISRTRTIEMPAR